GSMHCLPSGTEACDGRQARRRPADGAFVRVKEALDAASIRRSLQRLPSRPRHFRLPTRGRSGCLPPASLLYEFRVAKRAFYVWVSVGRRASPQTRAALRRLLDGLRIARYATP